MERVIAAIAAEILAGNRNLPRLCLALADWHAELRILQDAERRQAETRRREVEGMGESQAFGESQALME